MMTSEGNKSHRCITTKIDPDLGDIAKLIVANAKRLADLEREGKIGVEVRTNRLTEMAVHYVLVPLDVLAFVDKIINIIHQCL